jgi:hypothetical protein
MKELAYACRVLRRAPGPTGLSVVTIGIGIAVSTVLFTLIGGVVLRPLSYPTADRLVTIVDTNPELGVDHTGAASGNIDDWRRLRRSFEGIAGYDPLATEVVGLVLTETTVPRVRQGR